MEERAIFGSPADVQVRQQGKESVAKAGTNVTSDFEGRQYTEANAESVSTPTPKKISNAESPILVNTDDDFQAPLSRRYTRSMTKKNGAKETTKLVKGKRKMKFLRINERKTIDKFKNNGAKATAKPVKRNKKMKSPKVKKSKTINQEQNEKSANRKKAKCSTKNRDMKPKAKQQFKKEFDY